MLTMLTVRTIGVRRHFLGLVFGGVVILQIRLTDWIEQSLQDLRADFFPVDHEIAVEAYRLPEPFQSDPADRQIVACARLRQLHLVTADPRILRWPHVPSIDARK
jgi:PIN domain nuclease of toxin-antitoxin system